ncbi:hypothetical protein AMECASPLE_008576 [Ameca splendens]|uniref:Uncharacterized protein n=1 Tax=Ameca splendens TaxID=208324 RepID=A0ABV0ZJN7_9TELE
MLKFTSLRCGHGFSGSVKPQHVHRNETGNDSKDLQRLPPAQELPWRETSSRYGDTDKPQLLSTLILEFSKVGLDHTIPPQSEMQRDNQHQLFRILQLEGYTLWEFIINFKAVNLFAIPYFITL